MSTFLIILCCYLALCIVGSILIKDDYREFIISLKNDLFESQNGDSFLKKTANNILSTILIILAFVLVFVVSAVAVFRIRKFINKGGKKEQEESKVIRADRIYVPYDGKRSISRRQIFYVENEYNSANNEFIRKHYDEITEIFAGQFSDRKGFNGCGDYAGEYEFVYLPFADIKNFGKYMSGMECNSEADRENFIRKFYGGIFDNIIEESRLQNGSPLSKMSGLLWLEQGSFDEHTSISPIPSYEYRFFQIEYSDDNLMFEKIKDVICSVNYFRKNIYLRNTVFPPEGFFIMPFCKTFTPSNFQVTYVENHYDEENNDFICRNYDRLCTLVKTEDVYKDDIETFAGKLRFEYLPKSITTTTLNNIYNYYSPSIENKSKHSDADVSDIVSNFYELFFKGSRYITNKDVKSLSGIVRFKSRYFIKDDTDEWTIGKPYFLFSFLLLDAKTDDKKIEQISSYIHSIGLDKREIIRFKTRPPLSDDNTDPDTADIYFTSNAYKLIDEIKERIEKLNNLGINSFVINKMLLTPPRLSRLKITADYRILLTDYNKEIKMTPLPKAVFFFFLRHPEGVIFKHLIDYKDELLEIYKNLTVSEDEQKIKESIDSITDSTKNSINEKCSRIREAFIKEICEDLAENYFITQNHKSDTEPRLKLITLDRTMVSDDSGIL